MTARSIAKRVAFGLLGPAAALLVSLGISAIVLSVSGHDPWNTYSLMAEYGSRSQSIISVMNRAVPFYFSALAVAIGFKMGLFNIGVEGQYRLAAVLAAAAGAAVTLPAPLHDATRSLQMTTSASSPNRVPARFAWSSSQSALLTMPTRMPAACRRSMAA